MLAEDINKLFGQRQMTLFLLAITVARVSVFSCAGAPGPDSHRTDIKMARGLLYVQYSLSDPAPEEDIVFMILDSK